MKLIRNIFCQHPNTVGETYFVHMFYCMKTALLFILYSLIICIHGLIPALFTTTASSCIEKLYNSLHLRREKAKSMKD